MTLKVVPLKQQGTPWKGIISDYPYPLDTAAFTDAQNFLFRMGRIQTRPRFNPFTLTPDGARARLLLTFLDAVNSAHTLLLTTQNAYMLTNPPPVWNLLGYPSGGIAVAVVNAGGAGYAIGDTGKIVGGTANATYIVTEIAAGVVTAFVVEYPGLGFVTGVGIATTVTTGGGNGAFTVDVTAVNTFANLAGTSLPYGFSQILNSVYFSNGSVPVLYSDGEASLKIAGNVPGSARFMAENQQTLIIAATTEPAPGVVNSTFFPNRVRFSANGLPNEWDPTVDISAGFNDLIEVPDVITGLTTQGRNSYVYRTNGITTMYPTGVANLPFAFEDFSVAPEGQGNIYPYSLDVFNNISAFVSADTVRTFDGSNMTPIATGKTRKRIYHDLRLAAGDSVWGKILPNMGPDFPYLAYWLNIPGPDISWVYNFDEDNWTRVKSSEAFLSALGLVSVGS